VAGWLRATLAKAPPMEMSTVTVCQVESSKSETGRHPARLPQVLMSSQMVAPL
jgi:hypothetical protein